jgi:hypothetical protein
MNTHPSATITEQQLNKGLKYVTADGLSAEAMVVFTSGTFLTALAIHMGHPIFNWACLQRCPLLQRFSVSGYLAGAQV